MADLIGQEGVGHANIFGKGTAIPTFQNLVAKRQKEEAVLGNQYKAARDKHLEDLNKWNPDKTWDEFYDIVSNQVKSGRDKTRMDIERNGGRVDSSILRQQDEWQARANENANKANALKEVYTAAWKEADANPLYNKPYVKSKLNDKKDEWHKALTDGSSIDDDVQKTIMTDPRAYNENAVVDNFVNTLDDQAMEVLGKTQGPNGEYLTKSQLTSKLPYETMTDKNGLTDWKRDKDGKRILKMDDTLYMVARNNQPLRLLMEAAAGDDETKQKEWLAQRMPGFDKTKQTSDIKTGFRNPTKTGGADSNLITAVSGGENTFKPWNKIGADRKIGFDNITFGYSSPTVIEFAPPKDGEKQFGTFDGLGTNLETGEKQMKFISKNPDIDGVIPYDEKLFQQVRSALPAAKRAELDELKYAYDEGHKTKNSYEVDDAKVNTDADAIDKYYKDNAKKEDGGLGTDTFNQGLQTLLKSIGLDKDAGSFEWGVLPWNWGSNGLTIGDKKINPTTPEGKEELKQTLYDLNSKRYSKPSGKSATSGGSKPNEEKLSVAEQMRRAKTK